MDIQYRTNLDNVREFCELNKSTPEFVPPVGMCFTFALGNGRGFQLEVVAVTYNVARKRVEVELHIPSSMGMSITEWQEYMKRVRSPLYK